MSINMANVKSITLGGVEVKKIEDTSGNVLWGGSTTATINITVGASQDITTTQYYNRIVLPSLSSIKSKVASKIGTSSSNVNITKVEIDCSTLYWYNPNNSTSYLGAKATTSSSLDSGTSVLFANSQTYRTQGVCQWSTSKTDVTKYLGTQLYGYWQNRNGYSQFNNYANAAGYGNFCNSSGSKPIFTLVVTYQQ